MYSKKLAPIFIALMFVSLTGCNRKAESYSYERLNAVLWMQTSAEYNVLCTNAYKQANAAIDTALAQPDWSAATEQTDNFSSLPPAVVLDIDETVLDNLPYQAQLIKTRSEFNSTSWT